MKLEKWPRNEALRSSMIFLMVYVAAVLATTDCIVEKTSNRTRNGTREEHIHGQGRKLNHSYEDAPGRRVYNDHSAKAIFNDGFVHGNATPATIISVNDPEIPADAYKVRVIGYRMITPRALQLTFSRLDGLAFNFAAGQYITFLLPHDGNFARRSYSLANSPDQFEKLEIAVTAVEDGFATSILFGLKIGDELLAVGPRGDTLLLKDTKGVSNLVLVATGTGVAPYRSMLPTIAKRFCLERNLNVTLLLGVRRADELLYAEDFIAFDKKYERFHFRGCLSREQGLIPPYQYSGYVQSIFEKLHLNPLTDLVYLVGKPRMVDNCVRKLTTTMGFGPERIVREKYISSGV